MADKNMRRARSRRQRNRRGRNNVMEVNVISYRIIMQEFLKKAKHVTIYTLVTCGLVLLCWGIFYSARKLMIEGDRFELTAIEISPEPTAQSFFHYANVPSLTGIECGESIFLYNIREIAEELEAMPEALSVNLARRYPGTIELQIEERSAVAKIQHDGEVYLVDTSGLCYRSTLVSEEVVNGLPEIMTQYRHDRPFSDEENRLTEVGMQRALNLAQEWKKHYQYGHHLCSIQVKDLHSLSAITSDGIILTMGYYEHERQIKDYNAIHSYIQKERMGLERVNLLPFENIPVVFDKKTRSMKKTHNNAKPKERKAAPDSDIMMILNRG